MFLQGATASMAQTMVGTPYYMSPELVEGQPYNVKSDVWAVGCLLYELLTFKHPFNGANQAALLFGIMRGKYPPVDKFEGVCTIAPFNYYINSFRKTRRTAKYTKVLRIRDMQ